MKIIKSSITAITVVAAVIGAESHNEILMLVLVLIALALLQIIEVVIDFNIGLLATVKIVAQGYATLLISPELSLAVVVVSAIVEIISYLLEIKESKKFNRYLDQTHDKRW